MDRPWFGNILRELIRGLAEHSYKGYALNMIAAAAACALLLATPVSAAPPKHVKAHAKRHVHRRKHPKHHKPRPLTWEKLAERVIKEGVDHPLRAPLSRNLGFAEDTVPTKAVRYTSDHSTDGWEYAIYVIPKTHKEPREIVVGITKVRSELKSRYINSCNIRFTTNGKIIGAVKASGFVGQVVQTPLSSSNDFTRKEFARAKNVLLVKMARVPFDK